MPKGKVEPKENEMAPVAAAPLTPAEKEASDRIWNARIEEFQRRHAQCGAAVLQYYYDLGDFAKDLFENARKWGNRTAENLAQTLKVHPDTLRRAMLFKITYSDKQLKAAIEKGLSFTDVRTLVKLTDLKQREALENKLAAGEITQIEAERTATKMKREEDGKAKAAGKKPDTRGGGKLKTSLKAFEMMSESYLERISNLKVLLEDYNDLKDPERKKELISVWVNIKQALSKIGQEILGLQKKLP